MGRKRQQYYCVETHETKKTALLSLTLLFPMNDEEMMRGDKDICKTKINVNVGYTPVSSRFIYIALSSDQ